MDLRLGLSLSYSSAASCEDDFDLNIGDEEIMGSVKKRCFGEAFDLSISDHHHHKIPKTLSLLALNDNREQRIENEDYYYVEKGNVEEDDDEVVVVGWPPIKSWKKKTTTTRSCQNSGDEGINVNCVVEESGVSNGSTGNSSNSLFVKVKMEGVGIARKVDLCLHQSPKTLLQTLLTMFGKSDKKNGYAYKLTFQDKEGYWRLAEDVPWGNLIRSVDRLQLSRKTC